MNAYLPAFGHLYGLHRAAIEALTFLDFIRYREYAAEQIQLMQVYAAAATRIVGGGDA